MNNKIIKTLCKICPEMDMNNIGTRLCGLTSMLLDEMVDCPMTIVQILDMDGDDNYKSKNKMYDLHSWIDNKARLS